MRECTAPTRRFLLPERAVNSWDLRVLAQKKPLHVWRLLASPPPARHCCLEPRWCLCLSFWVSSEGASWLMADFSHLQILLGNQDLTVMGVLYPQVKVLWRRDGRGLTNWRTRRPERLAEAWLLLSCCAVLHKLWKATTVWWMEPPIYEWNGLIQVWYQVLSMRPWVKLCLSFLTHKIRVVIPVFLPSREARR